MKNTKNTLITGVALMIALFASIQVTAMEPGRKVNPHLKEKDKEVIASKMQETDRELNEKLNKQLKNPFNRLNNYKIASDRAWLNAYKTIYYGNKPYGLADLSKMVDNNPELKQATELYNQ